MPINVQDASEQREIGALIPDGTFVHLIMQIRPGGASRPSGDPQQDQMDAGLFKQSTTSDVVYMDCEFTVLDGSHSHQKIWSNMTIAGGQLNPDGTSKAAAITHSLIRAILNSAIGLDPKDASPSAVQMRTLRAYSDLNNIEFWARVGVQAGGDRPGGGVYDDKNTIALVIEPDRPEYVALKAGQEVAPQPRGARSGAGAARVGGTPANGAGAPAVDNRPAWQRGPMGAENTAKTKAMLAGLPESEKSESVAPSKAGPSWLHQ